METVTVNGKVYQIGALYWFGSSGIYPLLGVKGGLFEYGHSPADEGTAHNCEEISLKSGTITDAPIDLEDGEWYFCGTNQVGGICHKYTEASDGKCATWYDGHDSFRIEGSNVKPLYKMVKA